MASRNTNLYRAKALERFARRTTWNGWCRRCTGATGCRAGHGRAVRVGLFWAVAGAYRRSSPGAGAAEAGAWSRAGPERRRLLVLTVRAGDEVEKARSSASWTSRRFASASKRTTRLWRRWGAGSRQDRLRPAAAAVADAAGRRRAEFAGVQRSTLESSLANARALVEPLSNIAARCTKW